MRALQHDFERNLRDDHWKYGISLQTGQFISRFGRTPPLTTANLPEHFNRRPHPQLLRPKPRLVRSQGLLHVKQIFETYLARHRRSLLWEKLQQIRGTHACFRIGGRHHPPSHHQGVKSIFGQKQPIGPRSTIGFDASGSGCDAQFLVLPLGPGGPPDRYALGKSESLSPKRFCPFVD